MGRVGDVIGRKKIFSTGIAIFTVSSLFASFSGSIVMLIAFRVVQGIGGSMMSSCSTAIVTDAFLGDRGKALGINTSATYSGITFGPLIGGLLVQGFGWRSIFYVNIPIGIVSLLLVTLFLPRDLSHKVKGSFDLPGSITLSIFLLTLMLFLSQSELYFSKIWFSSLGAICATSCVTFVVIERKIAKAPVIDLNLFTHNRLFSAGNLTSMFNYTTSQAIIFVMSLYLQLVLKYSYAEAGLVLFAQPVVQVLVAPIAGTLSDRLDARILSSIGTSIRAAGLFALSFLETNSPAEAVLIPMAIIGLGHGLFAPPNTNSVMSSVSPDKRGVSSGIRGTIRTASSSVGLVLMSSIIASAMPSGAFSSVSSGSNLLAQGLASSFVLGVHYSFLFAGAFTCLGILTSLVRGREHRETYLDNSDCSDRVQS
jgi:EmrB/QacA subfamily drug resistance transporter